METNRDKPELEEIDKVYDIDFDVTELLIVASILFFIWYLNQTVLSDSFNLISYFFLSICKLVTVNR